MSFHSAAFRTQPALQLGTSCTFLQQTSCHVRGECGGCLKKFSSAFSPRIFDPSEGKSLVIHLGTELPRALIKSLESCDIDTEEINNKWKKEIQ